MNGMRGLVIAALTAFMLGATGGLIAGVVLAHSFEGGWDRWRMERRFAPPARPLEGPIMRQLERRLDFSPEQRDRIERIFERARTQHEAVRESTRAAIERELTAQQKEGWERLELRLRHRGRLELPPPPPEPESR